MDSRLAKIIALAEAGKLNTEIGLIVGLKKARVSHILKQAGRHDLCGYKRRSARGVSPGPKSRSVRTLPTKGEVRAAILYDPINGTFHWKERPEWPRRCNARFAGKIAGGINIKHRYYEIRLNGILYGGHTIAWIHERGKIPAGKQIDHWDLDRSNNKWLNLRLATGPQNHANRLANVGRALPKGVYQRGKRFYVKFCHTHVGVFSTVEEAKAAYIRAAAERFGDFARIE